MSKLINLQFRLPDLYKFSVAEKIQCIKNGISKAFLVRIKDEMELDYNTLAIILSVSRVTLVSKKTDQRFYKATSERILLLADLYSYGLKVFEDKGRLNAWLKQPCKALGGNLPIDIMDTIYGLQEVKNELGRIEYGVY
jgi:putative toxin-antitoxin system antitoxin component (TIGR02293 family)